MIHTVGPSRVLFSTATAFLPLASRKRGLCSIIGCILFTFILAGSPARLASNKKSLCEEIILQQRLSLRTSAFKTENDAVGSSNRDRTLADGAK